MPSNSRPTLPPRPTASEDELRLDRLRKRRRGYPLWRLLLANAFDFITLVRESWVALAGFSIVAAINTIYLLAGYHDYANSGVPPFTFGSAVYETLRMLVLQSGLPLPENDPVGQVLFFLTPLLGLALIFQSVLNFGRLLLDKGSRREAWQVSLAATLRDHVVVCGLGRISYRVVLQLLDSGYEAVVVERDWDTEFAATIRGLKVPIVSGDARDPVVLRQAGVLRARGLIAAINDDLLNVEIALAARRLRPDMLPVMRIFNQELDINLERAFGRNTAFSSSALAAPTLAAAALSQAIVQVLPLPDGLLGVAEITVAADSQIAGFVRGVEDRFGVRVLRYRDERGREQMPPRSIAPPFMRKLEGGDVVLLLGPLDALEAVRQHNQPGSKIWFLQAAHPTRTGPRMNTVIVCGLGKIGYRVVQVLHQSEPRPEIVVVCGEDTRPNFLDTVRSLGVRVVCGDAREPEVLVAAGIEQAYSVAAVVSNDLTNLQIGLTARRLRADIHVVLRVFSDVLAERLATLFGIHTTFSSSALAAPTLAAATIARDVDYAIDVGQYLFSTLTINTAAGDMFAGRSVAQVRDEVNLLVVALRRSGASIHPLTLDTAIQPGDQVIVLGEIEALARSRSEVALAPAAPGAHRLTARPTQRLE